MDNVFLLVMFYNLVTPLADRVLDTVLPFVSQYSSICLRVFGTNKTEWSTELLRLISADQLYIAYGGTRLVKPGTKRIELAL